MSEPREPDPHLRIERERVLPPAVHGHGPTPLDHRHHASDWAAHRELIRERREAFRLLPRAHDLALDHDSSGGRRAERDERLDLPHVLPAERRARLRPQARQGPVLKAVPYVELQRGADAVEGVGLTVERRPSAGLQLKALAQPVLVDELLTARRTKDDDL